MGRCALHAPHTFSPALLSAAAAVTLPLRPVFLPAALEGSSDAHSDASEDDSGSEHSDEEDADRDLEDGSGENTDVLGAPGLLMP